MTRALPFSLLLGACGVIAGPSLAAAADTPGVEWRAFDRDAFREAEESGRPVFLLLTAPWNRDHFLLPRQLFADSLVVSELDTRSVPVRADVTLYPELRQLYSIASGLVPSFHFLDAEGRARLSVPPVEREELQLFLSEVADPHDLPPVVERRPRPTWEVNPDKLANRIQRQIAQRLRPGGYDLSPPHADLDVSALASLLEYAAAYPFRRRWMAYVDQELRDLLSSPLHDPTDGGFHRAIADPKRSIPHFEKTLRANVEIAALCARWFRMAQDPVAGVVAARTVRSLNNRFRTGDTTLYAGSLAADLYRSDTGAVRVYGAEYYSWGREMRRRFPGPDHSEEVPVGSNFVLHQSLVEFIHTYGDESLTKAVLVGGRQLLERGFDRGGAARRALDHEGPGNLRDQGDAGSGLLAYHGVSGDPDAMEAAVRVGRVLLEDFWDEEARAFRNVSRRDRLPDFVREADPDPAWNGIAIRFLIELAAVTGEERWRGPADASLRAWADHLPVDGIGIGEIGRAALRAEAPLPVLFVVVDPDSPEGEEARRVVETALDPLLLVRWIEPGRGKELDRFGLRPEKEPAMYFLWGDTYGTVRDEQQLRTIYRRARRRVRG